MRKLLTALMITLALCGLLRGNAMAASPGLSLMAGAGYTSMPDTLMSPGDEKISYWGGVRFQFSPFLGILGTYDYLKTDVVTEGTRVSWSTFTGYASFTAFAFKRGDVSVLAGLEWFDTNVSDFDYKEVDFTWGLAGVGKIGGGVGIFGMVTNTLMDDAKIFDVLKARAGVSYTF